MLTKLNDYNECQAQEYFMPLKHTAILSSLLIFNPITVVATQPAINTSSLDCVIIPGKTVELSSSVRGRLKQVLVERGDKVKKNQVVARLNSSIEKANVALSRKRADGDSDINSKKEKYEFSKRSLERINTLLTNNAISEKARDESRTNARIDELEYSGAKEQKEILKLEHKRTVALLSMREIRTPIDGVIVDRYKSPGEYIDEEAVLKIVQINPLNVELIAPMSLFGKFTQGKEVIVKPEAPIGGEYKAKISIIDDIIDDASGTFRVRLILPNPKGIIPAGLGCHIENL